MSLYADYLHERTNDQIIETDKGFATYRFLNEKQVYIIDIYVKPEYRRFGAASAMGDYIVEIAKTRGCSELIGAVVPSTKNSAESLKFLLGYGMKLESSAMDMIVFKKEI